MVNFRIIARVYSLLLIFEALFMFVSAGVSYIYQEDTTSSFLFAGIITIITGLMVFTPLRNEERIYGNKEGYIIVTGIWIIFSLFGTLPYLFSGSIKGFADAFFEAMSGFTTTGATIIDDVEALPYGIIFWRSLTQWIGGIGIIMLSLSLFPVVKSINIQLAATEFSVLPVDKIHPRTISSAKRLITIYFMITVAETILLAAGGMPVFDAICLSLSTLSTGGFSTHNNGVAAFASPYFMLILTIFMFVAGINMPLIYFGLKGFFRKILSNNELIFYSSICLFFIALSSMVLVMSDYHPGEAIVSGAFHVVSIISTTGFYTQDFNLWGDLMMMIIFVLMFTGGMAGSTSGGIKMVRLLLLSRNNRKEMKTIIHPNAVVPVRLDFETVPTTALYNLLVFSLLYFVVLCAASFILSFMGYDIVTSFSTSASMLGNIGPALGTFGPSTDFSELATGGKMFLALLMIIGRLELVTVLILFTRNFYRH